MLIKRNFLDSTLCEELRREMASAPSHASLVGEETDSAVDEANRKSRSPEVSDGTKAMVTSRLEGFMPNVERHFGIPLTGCQSPQFLRYGEGDYLRPHADHEEVGPEWVTARRVSAVVFLNDQTEDPEPGSFSGGALTFFGLMGDPRGDELGFPLQGAEGLLVAFESDLLHSVTPVKSGERFTIVSWFA
jgi:predicted 2-oxoglutarate/Fe(II)-dependent dioxygenase YbiX